MLGQAYFRNPAGLAILGSESVGARPYFEMGVGLVAFFLLSVQVVNLRSVKQAMACHFLGSILLACVEMLSRVVPQVAARLSPFYRTAMATEAMVSIERSAMHGRSLDSGIGRLMYLRWFTEPLAALLFAWRRPIDVLNPLKIVAVSIFLVCIVCALFSGFRSQVVWLGLMFLAAGYARRRLFDIVVAVGIGIPALAVMLVLQGSVVDLPMPAQRALSFLPADWDHRAVGSAQGSTEWRLEMWKLALTTDRHIENKWLGDGFGFSAQELAYQAQLESAGLRPEELKEYYMTTGGFHSGPVETIRRVGYVGLLVLLVGFVVFSREAVRLIRLCLGTPYQMPALYFGLPLIVLPVMFVFVIGSYASAVGQLCVIGGLLRLIRNSYEAQTQEDYDSVPESSNATVHGKPLAATN
jgi:uncharacterized membrane protein (Fun14 family)